MTDLETNTAVGTGVLFENERIRVWEMVLTPGETCQPHRHVHDHLLLYAEPARIRAEVDGRPVIQHVENGVVSYRAVGLGGRRTALIPFGLACPSGVRPFVTEPAESRPRLREDR